MKKNSLWIIIAVVLVVVLATAGILYSRLSESYGNDNISSGETTEKAPTPAPDFTVIDKDGNKVKLSDFKGKPVVMNFWTSWCYYCKEEMPDFQKASETYPDVQFMMINGTDGYQETLDMAKEYLSDNGYTFDAFFDTQLEAVGKYYVTGFPATIFVDKDGNIAGRANGMIDYNTLERALATIL